LYYVVLYLVAAWSVVVIVVTCSVLLNKSSPAEHPLLLYWRGGSAPNPLDGTILEDSRSSSAPLYA
jgi:hypothetical protein